MKLRLHHLPPLALATLLGFLGCSLPEAAASQSSPPQVVAAMLAPVANNDCWYCSLDEQQAVAVWLSPRLPGQVEGGFRFVNLIYHDASQSAPILLHSSPVRNRASDPAEIHSGSRSMTARPIAGKTWEQVVTQADMTVEMNTQ